MFKFRLPFRLIAIAVWLLPIFFNYEQTTCAQATPASVTELRDKGIQLYRAMNFVESARLLKQAVEKNKADEQSWYYLGLALTTQPKELKSAAKAFETAI